MEVMDEFEPPAQEQKNLVLTLAKGSGISLGGRLFGRALLLVGQAILARTLGVNDYGLFSIGWTFLQISLAIPMGLMQGIIYFGTSLLADEARFRRALQQIIFVTAGLGLVLGTTLFLVSPSIADLFHKAGLADVLRGAAFAMALAIMLNVVAAATRVSRKMQFSAIAEELLPSSLILIGALAFTVLWRGGTLGSMLALILAYSVSVAFAFRFLFGLYPAVFKPIRWRASFFREILAFALPVSVAGILVILIQWITRLILAYLRPEAEVGLYQAASQIASLPAIILTATGTMLVPMASHLSSQGQMESLNHLFKIATKWSIYLSLPLFLTIVLFPATSLELVFGQAYKVGANLLVIMAFGQLINLATGSVGALQIVLGYRKQLVIITLMSLVITVFLNWWWIPVWGVTGAAVGNMIGILISNLAGLTVIRKMTGLWPYDRRYWKGLVAALLTLLPLASLATFFSSGIWSLVIAGLAACIVFPFALWRLGFDQEDQQFLAAIRQRLGF